MEKIELLLKKFHYTWLLFLLVFIVLPLSGCSGFSLSLGDLETENTPAESVSLDNIPAYNGEPYVTIHDNIPEFSEGDGEKEFETYSELDSLGRCGVAYANLSQDTMPVKERGGIGHIKPTGWQSVRYDIVEGGSLYNRCHLIAHCLAGEDDNRQNLITGTRYMNTKGMLPFENETANYIDKTGNHVLYRVTPFFDGDNLVASGVQMEAWSVEDEGEGICFNIYVYNVQPGIQIDYATGENALQGEDSGTETEKKQSYVLNIGTKKFHNPDCSSVASTKEDNKTTVKEKRSKLIEQGYEPCGRCQP